MKHTLWLLPLLHFFTSVVLAQTCEFYDDREEFLMALGTPSESLDFDSAALGPVTGDEFLASGFRFDSPLPLPNGRMEVAPDEFFHDSQYLSIDNRPFTAGQDLSDSLEIYVQGAWYAIGFEIVDGSIIPPAETIEVFDDDGNLVCSAPAGPAYGYVGIFSPEAIAAVVVTEGHNDLDDLGYDNFVLGGTMFADGFETGSTSRWSSGR